MAAETCLAATDIQPTTATLNGQADLIPPGEFLRFAYSTVLGGPYSNFTPNTPGDNSAPQVISAAITGLENNATYYYVVQHIAADGTTVVNSSAECNFTTTASFNPECEVVTLNGQAGTATLRATADFVPPESNLQIAWGLDPGGPYPNILCSVPGDETDNQQIDCGFINIPPCDTIYFVARVDDIPAEYIVDWEYAHRARSGGNETAEMRLGPPGPQGSGVLVDTHTAAGAGEGWTLRTGTFPVPGGLPQLKMAFNATAPPGSVGNFLDATSIILSTAGGENLGQQLINTGFEIPFQAPGTIGFPSENTPGIGWETTDGCNCLELWGTGALGVASFQGGQHVEMNAFQNAELSQIVTLDRKVEDSSECFFVATSVECLPANPVGQTEATLLGTACGVYFGTATRFVYGNQTGYPYDHATPLLFHDGTTDSALLEVAVALTCDTQYYYRVEAYDVRNPDADLNVPISVSDECSLTTEPCVYWCGTNYDSDDCTVVDFDDDGSPDYFNCNQF